LLIWQQPHPIFYAELCYQTHPNRQTLERYRQIVFESAEFMASYAFFDKKTGRYILGPPVIPAQENHPPRETWNPTFELAYWSFGLKTGQRWRERLGSCGVPRTGVLVRVVDDNDDELPAGEIGEVVTRSDCVMEGYWGNPAANAETLRGGWLHTGDLGSIDDDGFLTLRDRSKDMIISGGSNIYPREIEEVLLRHPNVVEASVVGRPHPDWGEEVVAFIVAKPGAQVEKPALDRLCLDHIARFKRPRDYRFVEALPKNNYGKVLKTELRQRLTTQP